MNTRVRAIICALLVIHSRSFRQCSR